MKKNNLIPMFGALSIGTLLEWADFTFYAYLAVAIATVFLPPMKQTAELYSAFAVFGVSYLARPFGSVLFGHIGDRWGRRSALTYSMVLMGVATIGIGVLPGYHQWGFAAAVLLICLRLLQGLSVAGEFMGAAVYLVEHHFKKWQFLPSATVSFFSAFGMLFGIVAAVIVGAPHMPPWAWRVPFIIGGLVAFVGVYFRARLPESEEFEAVLKEQRLQKRPVLSVLKYHWRSVVKVGIIGTFIAFYIYTCQVWWMTHVAMTGLMTIETARTFALLGQVSVVVFTLLMAWVAEYVGGRRVMMIGLLGACVAPALLFHASAHHFMGEVALAWVSYGLFNAMVTGVMFRYFAGLFPTNMRYSGQNLGWNIPLAFMGFASTGIATAFAAHFTTSIAPAFGIIIIALIAFLVQFLVE